MNTASVAPVQSDPDRNQKRLLRMKDLAEIYGFPASTIYLWRSKGLFPEPIQLAQNSIAWRQSTIEAWLDSRDHSQQSNERL